MKRSIIYVVIGVMLSVPPVFADTDYACLHACIRSGDAYTKCMPKCTYNSLQHPQASNASMDYACLKTCVDAGGASAICVPQCTSVTEMPAASATARPDPAVFSHDIFKAPVVSDGTVLQPEKNNFGQTLATPDYGCVKLCMQGGLEYALCAQRCIK